MRRLKANVSYFFDPNVDIDFDLRLSCSAGVMKVSVQNYTVKADSAW